MEGEVLWGDGILTYVCDCGGFGDVLLCGAWDEKQMKGVLNNGGWFSGFYGSPDISFSLLSLLNVAYVPLGGLFLMPWHPMAVLDIL